MQHVHVTNSVNRTHANPHRFETLPSSPDSLFAVLITDNSFLSVISICRPPNQAVTFRVPNGERISDIAFFDGKLYAILVKKFYVLAIDTSLDKGVPTVQSMTCITDSICVLEAISSQPKPKGRICVNCSYLVESSGRLLHVMRLICGRVSTDVSGRSRMEDKRTVSTDVSGTAESNCGQWRRVSSLGGQALFIGKHSRSLPAYECGAQEDCIYFMCDYDWANSAADPFQDCGVFNMRNGTITPLLPEAKVVRQRPHHHKGRTTWFFPSEAM
ncbi:hypothetical protein EJB05_46080, partial [Eragrostis curvula]